MKRCLHPYRFSLVLRQKSCRRKHEIGKIQNIYRAFLFYTKGNGKFVIEDKSIETAAEHLFRMFIQSAEAVSVPKDRTLQIRVPRVPSLKHPDNTDFSALGIRAFRIRCKNVSFFDSFIKLYVRFNIASGRAVFKVFADRGKSDSTVIDDYDNIPVFKFAAKLMHLFTADSGTFSP